ncbi:MAG: pyruvate, phosphate dikinase [Candidatus Heimdallarchaeota archaeon]|nr:pyruvate, phosphate dikinase [Candidatus Heimdallarchaeota archaeon]
MANRVFTFDKGEPDKSVLGGKGAALATMTQLGLPIPPGFTITTGTCIEFLENNSTYPEGVWDEVLAAMKDVEQKMGKTFNDASNPLLVSIRSGAKISMPGMMDTVLNCGLNDEITEAFGKQTDNPRFARDAYRRLIQMFADVVCGLNQDEFHHLLDEMKKKVGVEYDHQLTADHLAELIGQYKKKFAELHGSPFPQDPYDQLDMAIKAVFKSWNNARAIAYRNFEGIPHDIGTAVNVQSMAFGNFDDTSGTGVLFTRDPSSGVKKVFGEFLVNAQGEDVVAGIRTPLPLDDMKKKWPEIHEELMGYISDIEKHYKDMQDIEFTIQQGKLFILQTRSGKRTGISAAKIATDLVAEGLIDKKTAVKRLSPRDIEEAIFPSVLWKNPKDYEYADVDLKELAKMVEAGKSVTEITSGATSAKAKYLGKGLPAGPGAASGHVVFSSDKAVKIVEEKKADFELTEFAGTKPKLLLVKHETSPEDFHGMVASQGILTLTGGMTSHAALVGRQIGKRVIVGAGASGFDLSGGKLTSSDGTVIKEGDVITIEIIDDGLVFNNNLPIVTPDKLPDELETILDWADEIAEMKVRSNSDKEDDTMKAIQNKSTGTGLARTEHQFFDALPVMRRMILADDDDARNKALDEMEELQKEDFAKLFTVSAGRPVTIRLLDPPLHEFLPSEIDLIKQIHAGDDSAETAAVLKKVQFYQEANPMLGLRGVRLSLMIPRIIEIQTSAILKASLDVKKKGIEVHPEIMIPLVVSDVEFLQARKLVDATASRVFEEMGDKVDYLVGTMIEIPRAALTADEIAGGELGAEFFSFGTNDLTQMTFGFSRDDIGMFLPFYIEEKILPVDPFQTIDSNGVGKLMQMTVELGRKAAAEAGRYLKVGLCGEQGGDPESIDFCYQIGLDYVSCSPFRIPVARLAAAQATMKFGAVDAKYGKKLN